MFSTLLVFCFCNQPYWGKVDCGGMVTKCIVGKHYWTTWFLEGINIMYTYLNYYCYKEKFMAMAKVAMLNFGSLLNLNGKCSKQLFIRYEFQWQFFQWPTKITTLTSGTRLKNTVNHILNVQSWLGKINELKKEIHISERRFSYNSSSSSSMVL